MIMILSNREEEEMAVGNLCIHFFSRHGSWANQSCVWLS